MRALSWQEKGLPVLRGKLLPNNVKKIQNYQDGIPLARSGAGSGARDAAGESAERRSCSWGTCCRHQQPRARSTLCTQIFYWRSSDIIPHTVQFSQRRDFSLLTVLAPGT